MTEGVGALSNDDRPPEDGGILWRFGHAATTVAGALRTLAHKPPTLSSVLAEIDAIGVRSAPIAAISSVFVGMVMAIQFAYGLQPFGALEYTGRAIALSLTREVAPTLTALIVGSRMAAGITAELGAMRVTEQLDAVRSLGVDPLGKLVLPKLLAGWIAMPILAMIALVCGFGAAALSMQGEFGIPWRFFFETGLGTVAMRDLASGMLKAPFFGIIVVIIACHFGLTADGGTSGVGNAVTRSVVASMLAILISDYGLTKVSLVVWP